MSNQTSKTGLTEELSDSEIAVLKASSKLSEQEIRAAYADFKGHSPSGKVNKEQFSELTKKFIDPTDTDGSVGRAIFDIFDKNRDGVIDFSEFLAICATKNGMDLDTKLELSFGLLDISDDGQITYDEMVKFFNFTNKLAQGDDESFVTELMLKQLYEFFGIDKSQKLSKQQFTEGCKRSPELISIFGQQ